ncbi:MAG: hypothetical protein E7191_06330 [Erysipelotrichaceae bacterium]|nr:hypothetical protein [Erysipelotrichaceae bacterium]
MRKFIKGLMSVVVALAMVITVMPTVEVSAEEQTITSMSSVEFLALTDSNGVITLTGDVILNEELHITSDLVINGDGNTIASNTEKAIRIFNYDPSTDDEVKVVFNNVIIENSAAKGRCIDTRTGNITVELNNSELKSTNTTTNTQPITIGGSENGVKLTLNNTDVTALNSGYAIISYVKSDIHITNNSNVTGYGAIYVRTWDQAPASDPSGSTITIDGGSVVKSKNMHDALSNAFSTITLQNVDEVEVNVYDATLEAVSNSDQKQSVFVFQTSSGDKTTIDNNKVNLSSDTNVVISGSGSGGGLVLDTPDTNLTNFVNNATVTSVPSTEDAFRAAIANGGEITLNSDIEVTSKIDINTDVVINGNGNKIWTDNSKNIFYINANTTFEDVVIENLFADGRCINARANNIVVNVNNSEFTATGSGNPQPITLGTSENIELNVNDSTIDAGESGYAIISFVPGLINIDNSDLTGYGVLYMKGETTTNADGNTSGTVINVTNGSSLVSNNKYTAATNSFATVVFEDEDITLNIVDSVLKANTTGTEAQDLIAFGTEGQSKENVDNNTVRITGDSTITVASIGGFVSSVDENSNTGNNEVIVSDSVNSNTTETNRYIPEEPKSTVEFVVDGKVWRTYRVTKGADIRMPEVPEKEGYVGEWDHDGENIRTATTITAVYTKVEEPVNNTDLSDYADFQLPVYANSRVTNIATANGAITVEGYMFKANANLDNENSIWREIIFVNEEDYSMAKAYRKQVTPVYNTWLNKNMTATGNGTYKLDYANYTVTFSNTDINNYVGNTAATRMATGSYLAYMRISDGTDSYLFPLKDIVLSDGSTLALPSGFEVVDTTTRALRYIVK